jgi:hypothetical protein
MVDLSALRASSQDPHLRNRRFALEIKSGIWAPSGERSLSSLSQSLAEEILSKKFTEILKHQFAVLETPFDAGAHASIGRAPKRSEMSLTRLPP